MSADGEPALSRTRIPARCRRVEVPAWRLVRRSPSPARSRRLSCSSFVDRPRSR